MTGGTVQQRALHNTLVGALSFAVTLLAGFLTVPICLHAWGDAAYGAWLTLLAGFMMLRTIDSGYVAYVGNEVVLLYHQDRERLRRTLASALWVCLGLGAVQLLACLALVRAELLGALLGVGPAELRRFDLELALLVLVLTWTLSGSFFAIVHRVLVPSGFLLQANLWAIAYQLMQAGAVVLAALGGASIPQAALVYAALQAAIYLASSAYARHKVPELYPWWRGPDRATGLRDLSRSLLLTLGNLAQQAGTSGVVLFVSGSLGAAAVPLLTSTRTLANLWMSLAGVLCAPMQPETVRYHGTREHAKLLVVFDAQWLLGGALVSTTLAAALPLAGSFFELWTRGALVFDVRLFGFVAASVSLGCFGAVLSGYLAGINRLRAGLATALTRVVLLAAAVPVLVSRFGISGVGAGMWLAELICSVALPAWLARSTLQEEGTRLDPRAVLWGLSVIAPVQVVAVLAALQQQPSASASLLGILATCLIAYAGWKRLDPEVRSRLWSLARSR